uniref:Uncharacterized protein n=1 Tax=Chromera velia CCMP2878 TaxID=1169474 RepID=A0A0G4I0U3_9ALVE|eukprot:Cvel_34525.t1-p1 / transcript=Cvel_34525.t1 / gene=Cvel_34525 / organism=Chromera_velia_CCMP2878 / gene_product=hypothetical protein / transcript_product=hypothetical protein / location=Cvel_scaffold5963:1502-2716(-) / protein_length=405 / sequence_SO=supercontig / SO=protein_coding / is_pseudo=false
MGEERRRQEVFWFDADEESIKELLVLLKKKALEDAGHGTRVWRAAGTALSKYMAGIAAVQALLYKLQDGSLQLQCTECGEEGRKCDCDLRVGIEDAFRAGTDRRIFVKRKSVKEGGTQRRRMDNRAVGKRMRALAESLFADLTWVWMETADSKRAHDVKRFCMRVQQFGEKTEADLLSADENVIYAIVSPFRKGKYLGATSQTPYARWEGHVSTARRGMKRTAEGRRQTATPLYEAMKGNAISEFILLPLCRVSEGGWRGGKQFLFAVELHLIDRLDPSLNVKGKREGGKEGGRNRGIRPVLPLTEFRECFSQTVPQQATREAFHRASDRAGMGTGLGGNFFYTWHYAFLAWKPRPASQLRRSPLSETDAKILLKRFLRTASDFFFRQVFWLNICRLCEVKGWTF